MKKNIVIISDSINTGNIFCSILSTDYSVQTADDPLLLLEQLEQSTPDLLLTTLRHRKASCFDFLAELREKHTSLPVIIITNTVDAEIISKAHKYEVSDFFKLPVEPIDFCRKVNEILLKNAPSYERPDSLTGLHKKQYAQEQMVELLDSGKSGALFLIEVDKYSFASGKVSDATLKNCSEIILEVCDFNSVTSVTSDGFLIFVPNLKLRVEVEEFANNLINEMIEKSKEKIFISIGLAVTDRHGTNYDDLYQMCDLGLGVARQNGKNQCKFYKW